jgi:hypothetical protein
MKTYLLPVFSLFPKLHEQAEPNSKFLLASQEVVASRNLSKRIAGVVDVKYVPSSMAVKGQEAVVSGSVGYGQAGTWRGCECTRCPVARGVPLL